MGSGFQKLKMLFVKLVQALKSLFTRSFRKPDRTPLPEPPSETVEPDSRQSEEHACAEYTDLKHIFRDIGRLHGIVETLGRDFLTAMPEGAAKSRLGQITYLHRRAHEDLVNKNVSDLIEKAHAHEHSNKSQWDEWDSANLREMDQMYRHNCHLQGDLVEKQALLQFDGRRAYRDIVARDDWDAAEDLLQDMIDLQRRIADSKELEAHPQSHYDAMLQNYMPGTTSAMIDELFEQTKQSLDQILPDILDLQEQKSSPIPLISPFDSVSQMWLNRSLLSAIGFDFKRGGIYETGHNPVEGGTPDDTRLVIKNVTEGDFMISMKSALHEGGHGLYIQGLPRKQWRYQPVAKDLGADIQESQALLVEMILGRTPEFFEYLAPRVEGLFKKFGDPAMTANNLYALKTRVRKTVDRKRADEVTYFYHIYLRYMLEKDLVNGKLKVKDLPEAWNEKTYELLGVRPSGYADGCLQDVHWFVGKIGYFPSYAIGHMMAAQLFEKMNKDIQNIPDLIRQGEYSDIKSWLNIRIHEKGRLRGAHDLITDVTGEKLNTAPLMRHLKNRYLEAA